MHKLALSVCLLPLCVWSKQVVITITPDYPLTPTNTQIICTALHANLSSDAIAKLDSTKNLAYACHMSQNSQGNNELVITLNLKDT